MAALLGLGVANIVARATWHEVEDGVLWRTQVEGVVAAEIAAGTPASRAGIAVGDLLVAVDDSPVQRAAEVTTRLRAATDTTTLHYTIVRLDTREVIDIRLAPVPRGAGTLYFFLAGLGIFTLLVGAAVRLRRPRDPATLHFFWLTVAFFGVFTFSFSGRLNTLDWVFYWADVIAMLALPPMFLHFTLAFPDRPHRWAFGSRGSGVVTAAYVPAVLLGVLRVAAHVDATREATAFAQWTAVIDRFEVLYFAVCFIGGLTALIRALSKVRSVTARRQLRWIVWGTGLGTAPFALGYAVPYAAGIDPSLPMRLSALPLGLVPLAFASAIVRYRLTDIEVIVKRTLVSTAALGAIVGIYVLMFEAVQRVYLRNGEANQWVIALLATLVAVLLAPPVKEAVQTTLDRAFYRDRYDYRRALVGFARDLNSDLDLTSLADRVVSRVIETLAIDRMALLLEDEMTPHFGCLRAAGFGDARLPALPKRSAIGARVTRGALAALDEWGTGTPQGAEEIEIWRDYGLYSFVPCVANGETIAVLALGRKSSGAPLSSEDTGLLVAVAGQIATAIENARLYRQLHLKASELDRLRAFSDNIIESLDDGLFVMDAQDRVVRWNRGFERLYGISRAEAIGARVDDLFDAALVDAIRTARLEMPGGTTLSRLSLAGRQRCAGETRTVDVAVVPLRANDAAAMVGRGTIVIAHDVTVRLRLEEQLQLSEKMASIGLLAAGVAHEVNTPLTGISSFTQMLLEDTPPEDERTVLLQKIERQTFRAARIVNGLLSLSRSGPAEANERAPVDLGIVLSDVLALLEHQLDLQRIRVRRELTAEPLVVLGFEHKLQQVFLNLLLNAKDAMPRGGWLSIRTRAEGGRVIAEVADTGPGIPGEHLPRIYDPFFTTKEIGHGTGLGLSITYGIVQEHAGTIACESIQGQGTRFFVSLPPGPAASHKLVGVVSRDSQRA